jgi:hypothetical protein
VGLNSISVRLRAVLLAAIIGSACAWAGPITVQGVTVGTLTVNPYTDTTNANSVGASIKANFTTAGQQPNGQGILNSVAPLGLTYMQTVTVNTALQQLIFFPSDHTNANGFVFPNGTAFSDPPFKGYVLYDGTTQFTTDTTPWYSTITPAGTPGALPPTFNWGGGNNAQFFDAPNLPWADPQAGTLGIANLLAGLAGNITFETALVGVCNQPNPIPANAPTGQYKVCVLQDWTWGLSFTYTAGGSAGNYTRANYNEALIPLAFNNMVSGAFQGAFDQRGNNAPVEWNVQFVQADNCPEPASVLLVLGAFGGLLVYRRRKSSAA